MEVAREMCCEGFAELDRRRGLGAPQDVQKIKKVRTVNKIKKGVVFKWMSYESTSQ